MSFLKLFKSFFFDQFMLGFGGGGGAPSQTTSTSYNTNIPEYAKPYVDTMLGATQKQLFTGDTNAEGGMDITGFKPYTPYSTNPADYVAPFSPMQQQAQQGIANLQTPGQFNAASGLTGMASMGAMGAGRDYARQATNPYAVGAYMNPYVSQSLQPQLQEIQRQADITGQGLQGKATQQGAFGGNRAALEQAENQRNALMAQQTAIGQGYNQAYQQAQQAQQFGANLGLQGQQAALQGAGQLANIGGQQLQAQQGILGLQNQIGAQQQGQQQQMINQAIQDYANAQQYPLMQLGFMSNMLRGLPMQATSTNQYVAAPNPITQGIGAAGTGAMLYSAFGGNQTPAPAKAKGGIVGYNVGGETKSDLYELPLDRLEKEADTSPSETIRNMAKTILKERTGKASGGIIAFADGTKESVGKDADNANAKSVVMDPNYVPPVAPKFDTTKERVGRSAYVTRETPTKQPITVNPDIANSLSTNGIKSVNATPVNQAPTNQPTPAPQAKPAPQDGNQPTPAPQGGNQPVAQGPQGGNQPTPTPQAKPAPQGGNAPSGILAGLPPELAAQYKQMAADANKPLGEYVKEIQDEYKKQGIDNTGQQERRKEMMAERASARDEADRQQKLRIAQFFSAWGSTPGNTLVAGMQQFKAAVPDIIADKEKAAKAQRDINKAIYDLDESVRLEKKGDIDAAEKRKDKAKEVFQRTYGDMLKFQSDRLSDQAKITAAGISASGRGGGSEKTNLNAYKDARTNYSNTEKQIATEKDKDSTYKAYKNRLSDPKADKNSDAYKRAETYVKDKEATWNSRLNDAKEDVTYFESKVKKEGSLPKDNNTNKTEVYNGYSRPAGFTDEQWEAYKKANPTKGK